ncbi:PH domain-containing protein [Streptomyces monticola]|uniref:PH domain-containing protein n=1 Tax=Streptomyces monticola TaxID=2666263 RepID=A0ABW2JN37_9ACTN
MTSPDPQSQPERRPDEAEDAPKYADRVFRSASGIAGGVLLLALAAWLGGDALVRGTGRTPWLALAGLLCAVPLVIAYTVRPAVFANDERLRVRNPFRTITLPWASVEGLRSGYSSEVFAGGGAKFQLWAIPVSLRARKRASRRQAQAALDDPHGRTSALLPSRNPAPTRAPADQALDDLRELAELHADHPRAQGEPTVRWAYEIIAPCAAGAVLLVILLAVM